MFTAYPYLVAAVAMTLLSVVMILTAPQARRRFLIFTGLMVAIPSGILARVYYSGVWNPKLAFAGWVVFPEDVLWAFSAAVTANFLAILPFPGRLVFPPCPRLAWIRYLILIAAGITTFAACRWLFPKPTGITWATMITMAVVAVTTLTIRRDLWPVAVAGAIGYTIFHAVDTYAFTHIWPQTVDYWSPEGRLSGSVLRIPSFEFVWSVGFGSVWPLLSGYFFDLSWRDQSR